MTSIDTIKSTLSADLDAYFERTCELYFCNELFDAAQYTLLNGGKRLRALLTAVTGYVLGIDHKTLVPVMAAIEIIHCYSLIHDDLPCMDNSPLRRGKPTVWNKFGEAQATLLGDALITVAFEVLLTVPCSDLEKIHMTQYFLKAIGPRGMVEGQIKDLETPPSSLPDLLHLHRLKTGRLFAAACILPVYLSPFTDDRKKTLLPLFETFGYALGCAYQIHDDLLDKHGSSIVIGKPTQCDGHAKGICTIVSMEEATLLLSENMTQCHSLLLQTGLDTFLFFELLNLIQKRKN
jgi:geranylgeranyl pyrophosphate synthase